VNLRLPLPPAIRARIEWGSIAIALAGVACMVQPLTSALYAVGFWMLLLAGIVYVSTTFWYEDEVTLARALALLVKVVLVLLLAIGISVAFVPALL